MKKRRSHKSYTKEEIIKSSKKYTNQRDWHNNEPSIFRCANGYNKKNSSNEDKKFWSSCIEHMEYIFKPNGYWTYDRCKEVSLKFKTIKDFREDVKHRSVYPIIRKNGWFDLLNHLESGRKLNGYFTYENCKKEALKYKTRSEFSKSKSARAYQIINKNQWFDLLSHMKRQMTMKERVIYVYEFPKNKTAYVGLTCQIERRHNAHMGKETRYGRITSPVYHFMKQSGEQPNFIILSNKPINEEDAPKEENLYSEKYKTDGWNLLNKAKPGSLGSKYIWTKEIVKEIADKLTKHTELRSKLKTSIYSYVKNNEWWDEITGHLEKDIRENWNDNEALEIGYRYDSISLLSKEFNGVAKYIRKRPKLREELDLHWNKSKEEKRLNKIPTKEECFKVSLRYDKRKDFRKYDGSIFDISRKQGWLDEICSHMTRVYWTYDRCKKEALKYNNKRDITKNAKGCHNSIMINKWYELLSHMPKKKLRNDGVYSGKYSVEHIINISKQCRNKSEFQEKFSGAYKASKRLGILKELF